MLADIGGAELVGPAKELDADTFLPAEPGGMKLDAANSVPRLFDRRLVCCLAIRRGPAVAVAASCRACAHGRGQFGRTFANLAATLGRVAAAFAIAMTLGTVAGLAMGRSRTADRFGDPWLVVLLNLPALVIIVLPISGPD